MANEYDIVKAFQNIEKELIISMKRNLSRHIKEEKEEGFEWTMWQAEQLKSLKVFRNQYPDLFRKYFSTINKDIEEVLKKSYESGQTEQENLILEALKDGKLKQTKSSFFKINDRKLKALIEEAQTGISKASSSILRYTNDQYRKIIFNAQVYANSGAGTPEQAIDMATKDFLAAGINSIQYSNGNRVNIASYAGMAIRTASKRAYLQGEGEKRNEWGIHTVLVHSRGGGCPFCGKYQGKVFIDDVWSEGTEKESKDTGYPLLSTAIAGGLFHPNCKDKATTYFPGINSEPTPPTKQELEVKKQNYIKDQKLKSIDRNIEKYKRLELGSINEEDVEKYRNKRKAWEEYRKRFKNNPEEQFYKVTSDKKDAIIGYTKEMSLKECKDLIENQGIKFWEQDLAQIDNKLLSDNTKRLNELIEKYPKTKDFIKSKNVKFNALSLGKNTMAHVSSNLDMSSIEISLSKQHYKDYNELIKTEIKELEIKHCMDRLEKFESTYTITHEFGHFIESMLIDEYNKNHLAEFLNVKNRALNAKSVSQGNKILRKWQENVADKISQDIYEIALESNPNIKINDLLSTYGKENSFEFFAECFANLECGKPNELGAALEMYLKKRGII